MVSGFNKGSGFSARTGPSGKKPRKFKFNKAKAFGKFFSFFVVFLFFVVVSFCSGFFGGWFNTYLKKSKSGGVSSADSSDSIDIDMSAGDDASIEALIERVAPAVVGVAIPATERPRSSKWRIGGNDGFPFFPFLFSSNAGSFCSERKLPRIEGFGSGFFVNIDGNNYVITNNHVIKNFVESQSSGENTTENRVFIVFKNDISNLKKASIIGYDAGLDVAVLKPEGCDTSKIRCLKFIDSPENIKVGELTIAIGNPLTLEYCTVTRGIVSCLRKVITDANMEAPAVQTDAAINHGNSGGPLINRKGQVLGINTCKLYSSSLDQSEGIACAIEGSALNKKICEIVRKGLKNNGMVYPGLGVTLFEDASFITQYFGVVISSVAKNSPAEKAELKAGDIITAIDGVKIKNLSEWRQELRKKKVGDKVSLVITRRGQVLERKVEVE